MMLDFASSRVEGCFWEGLALCVCVSVLCVCAGVGGSFILGSAPPHALFDFFLRLSVMYGVPRCWGSRHSISITEKTLLINLIF